MWFVKVNNQVFTDYTEFKTFFELVNTNWNQVIELNFRVAKLIIVFLLAIIVPPKWVYKIL